MSQNKVRHVLLTGNPGVGKSTLTKKICSALQDRGLAVAGFYTEEVREGGRRVGFDIVDIPGGARKPLARVGNSSGPKVGQYSVHVADFESIALPILNAPQKGCILAIDEIGKMEMFSKKFEGKVEALFSNGSAILATIPVTKTGSRPLPLLEKLRSRTDAKIFHVAPANREDPKLIEEILAILTQ